MSPEKVKTLKQIIEFEIHLMLNLETSENECVNNICDAVSNLVDNIPTKEVEPHSYACPSDVEIGVDMERDLCQSYWRRELK